jgi:UDP-glucose 4-epimerase
MLRNIDYWQSAPLWDPDSIAAATRTWFAMLSEEDQR